MGQRLRAGLELVERWNWVEEGGGDCDRVVERGAFLVVKDEEKLSRIVIKKSMHTYILCYIKPSRSLFRMRIRSHLLLPKCSSLGVQAPVCSSLRCSSSWSVDLKILIGELGLYVDIQENRNKCGHT
jgi:hypothetical protein